MADFFKVKDKYDIFLLLTALGFILFFALTFIGMLYYPGGNAINSSSTGYSFWENYYSDLGALIARDGQPNKISIWFFEFAVFVINFGSICFAFAMKNLFPSDSDKQLQKIGSISLIIAAISIMIMGFFPEDVNIYLHTLFVSIGFILHIFVGITYGKMLLFHKKIPPFFGRLFQIFGVCMACYMITMIIPTGIGPLLQKIIIFIMIFTYVTESLGIKKFRNQL